MIFSRAALLFLLWATLLRPPGMSPMPAAAAHRPVTLKQCAGVSLSGAYLAMVSAADGPGFLLTISNDTGHAIKLAKPFPSSAHWYAQVGHGPWLWRASSGAGGALANALGEGGPVLAYPTPPAAEYLTVGAHQRLEVAESMRSSPVLRFRPGCQRCSNPQDERYRAVLAYAYLPAPGAGEPDLLSCGLRSAPIVMPPLE